MKWFLIVLTSAIVFAGCGSQQQDMAKFGDDLSVYMTRTAIAAKGQQATLVEIKAKCFSLSHRVNCKIDFLGPMGVSEKGFATNVRQDGNKFVWDKFS